jgi:hypothetical protein
MNIRFYRTPTIYNKGYMEYATIYLFIYFIKDEVVDKALKQPMTPIEHT